MPNLGWMLLLVAKKELARLTGNDHVGRQSPTGQAGCELCRTARRRHLLNNIYAMDEVEDVVVIARNVICHGYR